MIRLFIIFLIGVSLLSCNKKEAAKIEIDASLNITKTETGFNIYSNKGFLILEYTKQNCDSASLRTLDDIYQTAKEFYNQELPKEEKDIQSIKHSDI